MTHYNTPEISKRQLPDATGNQKAKQAQIEKAKFYQTTKQQLTQFVKQDCAYHAMHTDLTYMIDLQKNAYQLPIEMQKKENQQIRKLEQCLNLAESLTEC